MHLEIGEVCSDSTAISLTEAVCLNIGELAVRCLFFGVCSHPHAVHPVLEQVGSWPPSKPHGFASCNTIQERFEERQRLNGVDKAQPIVEVQSEAHLSHAVENRHPGASPTAHAHDKLLTACYPWILEEDLVSLAQSCIGYLRAVPICSLRLQRGASICEIHPVSDEFDVPLDGPNGLFQSRQIALDLLEPHLQHRACLILDRRAARVALDSEYYRQ